MRTLLVKYRIAPSYLSLLMLSTVWCAHSWAVQRSISFQTEKYEVTVTLDEGADFVSQIWFVSGKDTTNALMQITERGSSRIVANERAVAMGIPAVSPDQEKFFYTIHPHYGSHIIRIWQIDEGKILVTIDGLIPPKLPHEGLLDAVAVVVSKTNDWVIPQPRGNASNCKSGLAAFQDPK